MGFIINIKDIQLKLLVTKDIWAASDKPIDQIVKHDYGNIIGYTDIKPKYYSWKIEKGSILTFAHFYKDALVFIVKKDELEQEKYEKKLFERRGEELEVSFEDRAEFLQKEIIHLISSGTMTVLEANSRWQDILGTLASTQVQKTVSKTDIQGTTYISSGKDYYPSNEQFTSFADSTISQYIDQSILPTCDYIIDKRDTIDYTFTTVYKSEWGIWEAIREIVQNSMDTETRIDIYTPNNNTIIIHDNGKGLSIKDFMLGGGEKAKLEDSKKYEKDCNPEKMVRGAHGEGMKYTFLVLSKNSELYKFYHYSRCIRATAELITSKRFKEKTLNVHLDPIKPHKGTTFILNTREDAIKEIMDYCSTRFIYHGLYINGEKISHIAYDTMSSHTNRSSKTDEDETNYKLIGHIVNTDKEEQLKLSYDPTNNVSKPLYIRGIYVKDFRSVFSYDLICPYLDSARNIVDDEQLEQQIKRIYTNLIFKGIDAKLIAEKFVRALYDGKDINFFEKSIYISNYEVKENAKKIYREIWDIIFGKNAFIETNPTLTQLAMEQIYVERDDTGNIIKEVHYKPISLESFLERIFFAADVPKDSDIVVQKTIHISISAEDLQRGGHILTKNLKDAISMLCPIYDLDPEEEVKKWDVFLVEYKTENQPPKNLWRSWNNISLETKEEIFKEIQTLYDEFSDYPLILVQGCNLPIINYNDYHNIMEIIFGSLGDSKEEISSRHPDIARYIEMFENRVIPIRQKLGYYNHENGRFGIRYDCLVERYKTFTVVIHEYAHREKEVDDIDDYDSAMGKILSVIQIGYGVILNESLIYADDIYEHYILKTIFDNISNANMPEDTRNQLLDSLNSLPENISDVIFAACTDKKTGKYQGIPFEKSILRNEGTEEEIVPDEYVLDRIPKEEKPKEEINKGQEDQEEWEKIAYLPGGDYIESSGFTRSEENLDYMLKNYNWDARNKTLIENIEFDAHQERMHSNIHVIRIEHLTEPLVTNISKKLFPNSDTNRYHWIAHTNSEDIIAFNLRDDGKYPNVPWSIRIFITW